MTRTSKPLLDFVIYQAAWFACVLLSRDGRPWLGAGAMLIFVFAHFVADWEKRSGDLAPVLISGIYGFFTDSFLAASGLLSFTQTTLPIGPSPLWMIALWLGFGATLNSSMTWLNRNVGISALTGAVVGPLAYGGGVRLGLIVMGPNPEWTYAALAIQWVIALSLLPAVASASCSLRWNGATILRRILSITQFAGAWVLITVGAPFVLAVTFAIDAARKITRGVPMAATRFIATFYVYLCAEMWGILSLFWAWIVSRGDEQEVFRRSTRVQTQWATGLFFSLCRIFQLKVVFEDKDVCTPGPIIVMVRHCSHLDTLIPTALITNTFGIALNFVIKKELIIDPCVDIAGHRLRNHFVDRKSSTREVETQHISNLGKGLGTDQGAMIFPEGTRFTANRKARALERIKDSRPDLYERAAKLRYLLPVRPAGSLALLDAPADVIILGHKGLDALTTWAQLWNGDLVGKTIHIRAWRIPSSQIPSGEEERVDWLYRQWEMLDGWLHELHSQDAPSA